MAVAQYDSLAAFPKCGALPPSNVEPPQNPLLSRRSGVVADTPLRPLVHLFEISGPVRSFCPVFGHFRCLSGCCEMFWVRWEPWGCPVCLSQGEAFTVLSLEEFQAEWKPGNGGQPY